MNQDHFCAVMFDELAAFFADGIRHDDDCLIAADSTDECEADALIAAGRLNDNRIRFDPAFLFSFQDHVVSGSGFDGTADIESFKFHKNLRIARLVHAVEPDHRGMSHCFQNILINHNTLRFCRS